MGAYGRRRPVAAPGRWWGYLPLLLVSSLVVAMVYFVPSHVPDGASAGGGPTQVAAGQSVTGWGDKVSACQGKAKQLEGSGYSPPCFDFAAGTDNGGATSPGVTRD